MYLIYFDFIKDNPFLFIDYEVMMKFVASVYFDVANVEIVNNFMNHYELSKKYPKIDLLNFEKYFELVQHPAINNLSKLGLKKRYRFNYQEVKETIWNFFNHKLPTYKIYQIETLDQLTNLNEEKSFL